MKTLRKLAIAFTFTFATSSALAASFGGEVIVSDVNIGSQFPDIAFANGTIHVVWAGFTGGGNAEVFYRRASNATGSNFTPATPVNISASPVVNGNDRPRVAARGSNVVVGWNSHNDTGALYTRRSNDGGATWQTKILTAGAEGGQYSRIGKLFYDSAGDLHLVYYTDQDPPNVGLVGMVHHRMSCDNGASWGPDTAVTATAVDGDVDNEEASIGEFNGRFYISYRTSARGNPQGGWPPYSIFMKSGTKSGCAITNWSYPARHIAGGMPRTHSSSYGPAVFGDASKLHLAWWDNTLGADAYYRNGTGHSLSASVALTALGVNHLEPGGLASTPGSPSGGYESEPGLVGNGTTLWMAVARQTALDSGREYGALTLLESGNNGTTWAPIPTPIAASGQGATPRIALDTGNNQNLGIVWTEIATAGSARIKYRLYTLGALSGGPALSFQSSPNFNNVPVGTSASQNVTILNTGTAGNISGVAITSSGSSLANSTGDFQITSNPCVGPIGAGASCVIQVTFTAKAMGARTATLSLSSNDPASPATTGLSGTGVANGVGVNNNNVSAVVTGYYETILGRSPDAGGLNFWVGEANRMVALGTSAPSVNETFFAMSIQFFNSAEYLGKNRSNDQYVTDLYRTFFVREPDGPGKAFWLNELAGLQERNALLTNFLFSAEFNLYMSGIFGSPAVRPEINMTIDLYRGILGVLPDSGGFNFWLGQIRTAQCQGSAQVKAKIAELAGAFVGSAEYAAREAARPTSPPGDLRTRMHVSDLYNAFLRRGAEPSGFNYWVGQITGGFQNRDQVRASFIASPEFDGRVTQVINAGCFS